MTRKLTYLLIACFALYSCKKDSDVYKDLYLLDGFHTIDLNSVFEVILIEDSIFEIEIESTSRNIENVNFEIVDSVLIIQNDRKLKWTSPNEEAIKLYIKSKPLRRINANETCNIRTNNPITSDEFGITMGSKANLATLDLNCRIFYYWNSFPCGGKIILSGKTDEIKIWNTALMIIDAKNVSSKYALVENESKGVVEVTATENIDYKITGTGNIHLYGNPPKITEKNSSSSGKLIQF